MEQSPLYDMALFFIFQEMCSLSLRINAHMKHVTMWLIMGLLIGRGK